MILIVTRKLSEVELFSVGHKLKIQKRPESAGKMNWNVSSLGFAIKTRGRRPLKPRRSPQAKDYPKNSSKNTTKHV